MQISSWEIFVSFLNTRNGRTQPHSQGLLPLFDKSDSNPSLSKSGKRPWERGWVELSA